MNPIGTIKEFEDLIRQGYGYYQLCEKLNLTQDDIKYLVSEKPAFALVIKSRYGIIIDPNEKTEEPKPAKSLKRKKKQEPKQEQPQEPSNEEVTNANETVSEGQ